MLRGAPRILAGGEEHALLIDALIAAIGLDAVLTVVARDTPFMLDDLVDAGAIAPDAAALFGYLLRLLMDFGAGSESEGVWRITPANDLPEIAEVWRVLLADAPELVSELALAAAAAAELPRLLAEGLRQPETAPLPMIEHLLQGSPVSAAGIELICTALAEIAAQWPQGQPLRVLGNRCGRRDDAPGSRSPGAIRRRP